MLIHQHCVAFFCHLSGVIRAIAIHATADGELQQLFRARGLQKKCLQILSYVAAELHENIDLNGLDLDQAPADLLRTVFDPATKVNVEWFQPLKTKMNVQKGVSYGINSNI